MKLLGSKPNFPLKKKPNHQLERHFQLTLATGSKPEIKSNCSLLDAQACRGTSRAGWLQRNSLINDLKRERRGQSPAVGHGGASGRPGGQGGCGREQPAPSTAGSRAAASRQCSHPSTFLMIASILDPCKDFKYCQRARCGQNYRLKLYKEDDTKY